MSEHPAGWHPDPAGSARLRWWDGYQWTEHYAEPSTDAVAGGMAQRAGQMVHGMADRSDAFPGDGSTIWAASSKTLTGIGGGRYRLTAEYLYFERGTLSTNSQQVPVADLHDIDATQTMTQRARGVGTITLTVRRPTGAETITLEDIEGFRRGVDAINTAVRTERERLLARATTLTQNINLAQVPAQSAPATAVAPSGAEDVMETLAKLGKLRDAGVVTEAEFEAKKAELLGRI